MKFKNCTQEQLDQALAETNKEFNNNVEWNNPYTTLRVKNSHEKGARLGQQEYTRKDGSTYRKHITSACWHVHGTFFDKLLAINPKAVITTGMSKIYKDSYGNTVGNWEDRNIGSMVQPLYYSGVCSCE
jgi:hypothetical protein